MYKTSVTYENFDGEKVTKDLYFNLTKAEVAKLEASKSEFGGFSQYASSIIKPASGKPDPNKVIEIFDDMIKRSYGVRTETGEFMKSKEASEIFLSSEAYSELFMRLLSDEEESTRFFEGIMPRDLVEAMHQKEANAESNVVEMPSKETPSSN